MNISNEIRTILAPTRAEVANGDARIETGPDLCRWYGPADLVWPIRIEDSGEYHIEIAYSLAIVSARYRILLDGGTVGEGTLVRTSGYFPEKTPSANYELLPHPEPIAISSGEHRLALRIEANGDPSPVSVSDIRITPDATRSALAAEERRAIESRADLSWFRASRYGLMFHWTSDSKPRGGARRPYPRAVDKFDVEGFSDIVAETGAAYVMLTANHREPSFPAPLEYWESLYPGWTTERDLVDELIRSLESRGVKLFLYLNPFTAYTTSGRLRNLDGSRVYSNAVQIHPDCGDDYLNTTCRLLEEIGDRYGDGLAGYWFDSWYQPLNQFGSFRMEPVFKAAKTGNPGRLTCFNWWIRPVGTPWQEYWAGEVGGLGILPPHDETTNGMAFGAGKGVNGHTLLIMDDPWIHNDADTDIADPNFRKENLIAYIKDCNAKNAPVTINLGIYQDGGIGTGAAEVMSQVRSALRTS